jgi:hypothetical protein
MFLKFLAVLYELLYERVFGVEQPLSIGHEMMNSKPSVNQTAKPGASVQNPDKTVNG